MPMIEQGSSPSTNEENAPSSPMWTKTTKNGTGLSNYLESRGFSNGHNGTFWKSSDGSFGTRSVSSSRSFSSMITGTSSVSWNRITSHRRRNSVSSSVNDEENSPLSRLVYVLETPPNPPRGRSPTPRRVVNSFQEEKKKVVADEKGGTGGSYQQEGSMHHVLKLIQVKKGKQNDSEEDKNESEADIFTAGIFRRAGVRSSEYDCWTMGCFNLPSISRSGRSKERYPRKPDAPSWDHLELQIMKEESILQGREKDSQVLRLTSLLAQAIELEKDQNPPSCSSDNSKKRGRSKYNLQLSNLTSCACRHMCGPQHKVSTPVDGQLGGISTAAAPYEIIPPFLECEE